MTSVVMASVIYTTSAICWMVLGFVAMRALIKKVSS